MKGLYRYLSPFAPDISGACSVLYGLGGLIVICDAGGCAGNTCGFDEPRWFTQKSAIYSAGLRDLDAILGRDERLLDKIEAALQTTSANFIALIGTPVPSVIATDYKALCRLAEKRFQLPCLYIDTTGMENYDIGQQKAYEALWDLMKENQEGSLEKGIWGATPLDLPTLDSFEESVRFGMTSFEDLKKIKGTKENIVVSYSGLKIARMLKDIYGIPYDCIHCTCKKKLEGHGLILHQQIFANYIREYIGNGIVGSFFEMDDEMKQENDISFEGEYEFIEYVESQDFDWIMGDPLYKRALTSFTGKYIPLPHYAVSAQIYQVDSMKEYFNRLDEALWNE